MEMLQGIWKQHLSRARLWDTALIFPPSPPNYVTRSPGVMGVSKLKVARERPENFRTERDTNPDLCDVGEVLHHISCQANWEPVVVWVYDKSVSFQCK